MPFSYSKPHPFMTKKMPYPPCTGTIHTNQLTPTLRSTFRGASNLHIRVHLLSTYTQASTPITESDWLAKRL